MRLHLPRVIAACAPIAALFFVACDNAGADRASGITAIGAVTGEVYFDANGSRTRDADDVPFAGARVRLLSAISRDTVVRAVAGGDGTFDMQGVPVGSYVMVIDPTSGGDSAVVVTGDATPVTVTPDATVEYAGALSFPIRTVDEVRAMAPGPARVFVTGVALNARTTFSDTTVHVADATGSIRATRVRPSAVAAAAGDSVRLRARVATRLGQRVLDDVSIFVVTPTFLPTAVTLTTLAAATADAALRDAELVRLVDAPITDTATVAGNLTLTMNDGSGPVTVILDRAADVGFRPPFPPNEYRAPNRFDVTGLLVPTGTGTWVLKPRSPLDLTRR